MSTTTQPEVLQGPERVTAPSRPPKPEDMIRIRVLMKPKRRAKYQGRYEFRHMSDKFFLDIIGLEIYLRRMGGVFEARREDILSRLNNFGKVFLNLVTGEITT